MERWPGHIASYFFIDLAHCFLEKEKEEWRGGLEGHRDGKQERLIQYREEYSLNISVCGFLQNKGACITML